MAKNFLNIETITEYNDMLGVETLHPLVSVIDLSKAQPMRHMQHTFSFFAVFLKNEKNCELTYGRRKYDYQKGSVVALAPMQVIGIEDTGVDFQPQGYALLFHPDIIRGTGLASIMKDYSFFSYAVNEALHLSQKERETFLDILGQIRKELEHGIDKLSKRLIAGEIQLLLDNCLRFYERQFITRENENRDVVAMFDRLIEEYLDDEDLRAKGIPSIGYFADKVFLSANYFGDLVKAEMGKSPKEYIQLKMVERIKDELAAGEMSVSEIAWDYGFDYPQHLTRLFKKITGMTPKKYQKQIA